MKVKSVLEFNIGDIDVSVAMSCFGYSSNKADFPLIHAHANFEFHTVFSGRACLETEKGSFTVSENDVLVVFPDTFHKFVSQDEGTVILSFSFSVQKNERRGESEYFHLISERIARTNDILLIEGNDKIADFLKKTVACYYSHRLFAEEEKRALLILVFSELMSIFASMTEGGRVECDSPEYDTRIYVVEEYFTEHYMENVSLGELAEILHLSEKQTDRIIRRAYGVGFREQLSKTRMEKAKELLRDTDKSIKGISEAVGYCSYNGFYTVFKKKCSETPEEYRARKKQYQTTF